MSASPVNSTKSILVRIALRYLLVTIFTALLGAVYEIFSHGVYAYGMLYGFAFPLVGGVLPALLLARYAGKIPSESSLQLWHFGISAFTVGSLFSGALEIYGTSSRLTMVYWWAGGACLLLSLLTGVLVPVITEEKAVVNG